MTTNDVVEWMLDLDRIRLGADSPLRVEWHLPYGAWIIFSYVLLLVLFIVLTYRREAGSAARRICLGGLRGVAVGLVVAVICRPVLVLQRSRVQPSSVVLLVDDSSSMKHRDHYRDPDLERAARDGAGLESGDAIEQYGRWELLRSALQKDQSKALATLLSRHHLKLATLTGAGDTALFSRGRPGELKLAARPDSSQQAVDTPMYRLVTPDLIAALDAIQTDAHATDIAAGLNRVLRRSDGSPLAAVVLASDGQHTETSTIAQAIEAARARKIPILTILVGSPVRPRDLAIESAVAEETVFAKDILTVRAQVVGRGLREPATVEVHLVDDETDRIVGRETIVVADDSTPTQVLLLVRPEHPGPVRYRIEVPPLDGERETDNNVATVETMVVDEHLRVLYVEGYPRFEYRFLKNALLREDTVLLSALLLSADGQFAQEGDPRASGVRRFPESAEELQQYDVVLLGDVDPVGDWWSPRQAELLVDFVGTLGGGFGLIAGQRYAPHRFQNTPLEKLIPVRIDSTFLGRYASSLSSSFGFRLTAAGRQSRLFTFYEDADLNAAAVESWPGLYWIARTLGPKPGAEVLLEHATMETLTGTMPLMVLGHYGAGKVFFQGTDDTWQWRRDPRAANLPAESASGASAPEVVGSLHDAYWVQVVRALARPRQGVQDRRLVVRTRRFEHRLGEPVEANVSVLDSDLLTWSGDELRLTLLDDTGAPVIEVPLHRLSPDSGEFEATFVPPSIGRFVVRVAGVSPIPGRRPPEAVIRVSGADVESRRPEADHDLLRRIANETGGETIRLDQLAEALGRIPDRSIQIPDDVVEPLWDNKLVLVLFIMIITLEWGLRKAFNLA
ncbi:MAG: hypothetical protein IID37_04945 [Planctomycetes bacterium]|nr:hypothetical protein [Planctomycetota bacterium]